MQKLIVILGPTASGKSALGVNLARLFNGEVISADSRQVYKGLNIGSGKITKKEMKGVPHYLLDVANPKQRFSVAQYQKLALRVIRGIQKRGKLPFLVGGTGLYIQSVVNGTVFPEVPPNPSLRARLAKKSIEQLFVMLQKLDPVRAANIDAKNPHRLIRAIEINLGTGFPVPKLSHEALAKWDILQIGVEKSPEELKKRIAKRLEKKLKGMIAEVKKLHLPAGRQAKTGLSWRRLEDLGLEYKFVARLLQGSGGQAQYRARLQETVDNIQKESEQYAKRQMTWFKRDKRIHWITSQTEAQKLIKKFLN